MNIFRRRKESGELLRAEIKRVLEELQSQSGVYRDKKGRMASLNFKPSPQQWKKGQSGNPQGRKMKLKPDDARKIRQLKTEGKSKKQIAEILGYKNWDCVKQAIGVLKMRGLWEEKAKEVAPQHLELSFSLRPATEEQTVSLPHEVSYELWQDFVKMRAEMKHPITPTAQKLAIKKLHIFIRQGLNPNTILEKAIINGWRGLFK